MYTSILNLYFIYNLELVFICPPSLRSPGHPARSSLYFFVISKINIYSSPFAPLARTPHLFCFFLYSLVDHHIFGIL